MWPTYFLSQPVLFVPETPDCWDYLVGSGTTERATADGVLDDPDIVFPVVAGRTYRALGKVAFIMGETSAKKGGSPRVAWATTGTVEAMFRGAYLRVPGIDPEPFDQGADAIDRTEDDWTTELTLPGYPDGDTRPFYENLFVDLHITNVSASGNVVFRWGCVGGTSDTRVKLTTDSLVLVKEYLPA